MSISTRWNDLVAQVKNNGNVELEDLVLSINEAKNEPTLKKYKEILKKFEALEETIKQLPPRIYVEYDNLIRAQIANIYDKALSDLEKNKNIKKKTKWQIFVEEAERKNWEPIKNIIEIINKAEAEGVTQEKVEKIESEVSEARQYIIKNLSPYESSWVEKEFNKKIRILTNKIDRVVEQSFGDYIRELRKAKKWSLKDLESKTNVTASYIHRLENGSRKTPSIPIAERLAIGLGVPVNEFLSKLKVFGNDNDVPNRVSGLPEIIALSDFTINGKKVTKAQKEAMIDIVNQIIVSAWTPDTMLQEQHAIIKLVDKFKKL